jgi:chromosome segregation ATPase
MMRRDVPCCMNVLCLLLVRVSFIGNSTQRAAIDPCRECEAEGINGSLACQVMEECEQIHEERKAQAEAIERLAPEITSPVSSVPHSATQLPNIVENFDLNALHDSLVQAAADSEHCLATCEHAKAAREFQQELLTLQEDLKLLESDSRAKSANLEELEQQLATCRRTFIQKLQVIERLEYTVKEQAARIASLEQQARHIAENSAEIQNTSQPAAGSVTNTVALENSDQTQSTPVQQSRAPSLMTGTVTRLASLANSLFEKIPIPTSILQRGLQLALDLDSRH